jgi:Phosphate-selective porin O and P
MGKSRLGRSLLLAMLAACWAGSARAWTTLVEGEKGKLEMEARFMFWAVSAGKDDVPAGATPQTGSIDDFSVRRLRLLLRGQPTPSLALTLQAGQDNINSKIKKDDTGFRIKDAYLNYRKRDELQIVVGQFKIPFLRQILETGFNQLLVDRVPLPGARPAVESWRDLGGMVWGNHGGLQYRAALLDGSDQEDSNPQSSLRGAARVSYDWFDPEPGLSYTGTTLGQKRILQAALQADLQDRRLDGKDDPGFTTAPRNYRAWAGEFFLDQPFGERWAATAEGAWMGRRDDYTDPTLSDRAIRGYYLQGGLLLPPRVGPGRMQLIGRYESFDTHRGSPVSENRNRSLGLNYFAKDHSRKIQMDYTWKTERPTNLDNNELRFSVVVVF